MIRKFAMVSAFRIVVAMILATILAEATTAVAQQTPAQEAPAQQQPSAQQQPDNQQSGTQEASPEETMPGHKQKVKNYKNWTFNLGGGASLTNGTTRTRRRGRRIMSTRFCLIPSSMFR